MRKAACAFAVAAAVSLVGAPSASACTCVPLELDRSTFRQSDGAIIGKLIAKRMVSETKADYRYRVKAVFRGRKRIRVGRTISVRSAANGAACGLETGPGDKEGLLLERRKRRWTSNLCMTTSPGKMRRAARSAGVARKAGC